MLDSVEPECPEHVIVESVPEDIGVETGILLEGPNDVELTPQNLLNPQDELACYVSEPLVPTEPECPEHVIAEPVPEDIGAESGILLEKPDNVEPTPQNKKGVRCVPFPYPAHGRGACARTKYQKHN